MADKKEIKEIKELLDNEYKYLKALHKRQKLTQDRINQLEFMLRQLLIS